MARQISQTLNAVFECWDHPLLENQCCGMVIWSDIRAVIDIPCYFWPKSRGSNFVQNNMACLWQPLHLTTWLFHNIGFPKRGGLSIIKLHSKSVIFAVSLNFKNSIRGQPAITLLYRQNVMRVLLENLCTRLMLCQRTCCIRLLMSFLQETVIDVK